MGVAGKASTAASVVRDPEGGERQDRERGDSRDSRREVRQVREEPSGSRREAHHLPEEPSGSGAGKKQGSANYRPGSARQVREERSRSGDSKELSSATRRREENPEEEAQPSAGFTRDTLERYRRRSCSTFQGPTSTACRELIFTGLPGETMQDLILRVVPNWPVELRHLLPDGLVPRVMLEPNQGDEDGYLAFQTREGLQVEARIHRKLRRKFFDVPEISQDRDCWRKGSVTLLFFQNGDKNIIIQPRRGNRTKLTKTQWRGYTLLYHDPSLNLPRA